MSRTRCVLIDRETGEALGKTKCILIDEATYQKETDEQYQTGRYVGVGDAIDYMSDDALYLDAIDDEKVTETQVVRIDRIRVLIGRKSSAALKMDRELDEFDDRDAEPRRIVDKANARLRAERNVIDAEVVQ